jgi:hypothetical protein
MTFPVDELDAFPAPRTEQIAPTGVALVTLVNEHLTLNMRRNTTAPLDLPSLWRLSKHVVTERGPLLVYRFKDPNQ